MSQMKCTLQDCAFDCEKDEVYRGLYSVCREGRGSALTEGFAHYLYIQIIPSHAPEHITHTSADIQHRQSDQTHCSCDLVYYWSLYLAH